LTLLTNKMASFASALRLVTNSLLYVEPESPLDLEELFYRSPQGVSQGQLEF
jgi:hypothetical protein